MCEALKYILYNIYVRFGTKVYRQIVSIPMGTNSFLFISDLFLFFFERNLIVSLSGDEKALLIPE